MPACAEFGAWYPRFNSYHMHTPWIRYQLDMAELFGQRLKMYPGLVLWRSYAPTHFGGPTGTYTGAGPAGSAAWTWLPP